jgi:hypothetical protein
MTKFEALINDVNKFYSSVYNGAKRSAERVVEDLQQKGPSWTGRFSNSWQITEGGTTVTSTGQPGEPQPVNFPVLPASKARKFTQQDVVLFSIFNGSQYRDLAMDKVEGVFERPKNAPIPQTQLGLSKWDPVQQGRKQSTRRGDIGGGDGSGSSSRTAMLDWYPNYVNSGKIQRIITSELSVAVQRLP